jgi:nicotinamidase/pyrazinamidase
MKEEKINISKEKALIVVDIQYDFLPGGALAVSEGDQIIDGVNMLAQKFHENSGIVIFTQDWHPKNHGSFASSYPGKNPGDPIETDGLGPILWPDHCVQNTKGADISSKIEIKYGTSIVRKGYHQNVDSYSAFYENDKKTKTGLSGLLNDLGIKEVFICGLALDYCCFYTAIDAKREGFEVFFIKDLTRGIDQPENNIDNALARMLDAKIKIVSYKNF